MPNSQLNLLARCQLKRLEYQIENHGSHSDLRNTVKSYEKLVNKNPQNRQYRKLFYTYRSKFRRLCKHGEKMYKQHIYNDMSNNIDKNPKTFWNMLNKLEKLHTNHDSVHTYPTTISFSSLRNLIKQMIKTVNFMNSLLNSFNY